MCLQNNTAENLNFSFNYTIIKARTAILSRSTLEAIYNILSVDQMKIGPDQFTLSYRCPRLKTTPFPAISGPGYTSHRLPAEVTLIGTYFNLDGDGYVIIVLVHVRGRVRDFLLPVINSGI